MFARVTAKPNDLIGEGTARFLVLGAVVVVIAGFAALPYIPEGGEIASWLNKKRSTFYSSAFTFHSIFWAAMLTIWSMLKSRATRYVERLVESAIFQDFMRAFEVRIVFGLLSILFSFIVYIGDFSITPNFSGENVVVGLWLCAYVVSLMLLFDSMLTAKLVLD